MAPLGTCALAMPLGGGNPNGRVAKAWRWCRGVRRRTGWAGLASTVLAMAAGLVTLWYLWTLVFVLAPGGFGGRPSSGSSASRPDGQGAKEGPYMRALKLERLADIEGGGYHSMYYNGRIKRQNSDGNDKDDLFAFNGDFEIPMQYFNMHKKQGFLEYAIVVRTGKCAMFPTHLRPYDGFTAVMSTLRGHVIPTGNFSIITTRNRVYVKACPQDHWVNIHINSTNLHMIKQFVLIVQSETKQNDVFKVEYDPTKIDNSQQINVNQNTVIRLSRFNGKEPSYCMAQKSLIGPVLSGRGGSKGYNKMTCNPPIYDNELIFTFGHRDIVIVTGQLQFYKMELLYKPEHSEAKLSNAIVRRIVQFYPPSLLK